MTTASSLHMAGSLPCPLGDNQGWSSQREETDQAVIQGGVRMERLICEPGEIKVLWYRERVFVLDSALPAVAHS